MRISFSNKELENSIIFSPFFGDQALKHSTEQQLSTIEQWEFRIIVLASLVSKLAGWGGGGGEGQNDPPLGP